jgi:GT2 family glycosyltransferase
MKFSYHIPEGVHPYQNGKTTLLSTPSNGRVIIDRQLLYVWQQADGKTIDELLSSTQESMRNKLQIRAALACLAEAGLLARQGQATPTDNASPSPSHLISAIIVGYNSREWLKTCLPSLFSQTHTPLEVILVDNESSDGTLEWVTKNYPSISAIRLNSSAFPRSLASALNQAIRAAKGQYFFLLNPDVNLTQDALAQMLQIAQNDYRCAAVAAKLKFQWAPAFLNGIGNSVGALSWGTDSALGHLDLGQFDYWDEISSACFAAALIPAAAWREIGPIDEEFPLYYEDSEWCYRARLLGYTIRAAPKAVVYHAFSGMVPSNNTELLSPLKLERVVYDRLRFITKLLTPMSWLRFIAGYWIEDISRFALAMVKGQFPACKAYLRAWQLYLKSIAELRQQRRRIQAQRQPTDRALFSLQRDIPIPLIRNGFPYLTWDLVINHYLPLILAGKTRSIIEFTEGFEAGNMPNSYHRQTLCQRIFSIFRNEGWRALCHHVGKNVQWRLAKP